MLHAMRNGRISFGVLAVVLALGLVRAAGQQPAAPETAPAPTQQPATQQPPAQQPAAKPAAKPAKPVKKGKEPYTGPTTVIVLPATPMLDAEGRQQLDPDAKPMFNAPVSQMRDKKGHPMFDAAGKPVFQTPTDMGYDEHGKKIHVAKVKPPKMVALSVSRGTLTVDGMIGKAALNYDIADFKYMYLYAPWIGLTVVSTEAFPGAKEQPGAFNDKSLVVTVGEHKLEVASDKRMLGKKPQSAFVLVDRDFRLPSKVPEVGFGTLRKAPYSWPGSKQNAPLKGVVQPPPLPKTLLPIQALSPCPAGQMRKPGPPVLPGQAAAPQPCVPMVTKPVPVKLPPAPAAAPAKPAAPAPAAPASTTPPPAAAAAPPP